MHLEQLVQGRKSPLKLYLYNNQTKHIVLRSNLLTVTPSLGNDDEELGRIMLNPGGVKLEAVRTLHISAGHSYASLNTSSTDLGNEKYQLEPASDNRCEIIILRPGDVISSPSTTQTLTCALQTSEIQVNSSAAELTRGEPSGDKNGVADTPESETKDEDAPVDTITEVPVTQPTTQPNKSQPSATPHLVATRSVLVQETPTTNRIAGVDDYNVAASNEYRHEYRHVDPTPPREAIAVAETFSTARTGQSPRSIAPNSIDVESSTDRKPPQGSPEVRVSGRTSRKRASPESTPEASTRDPPAKRTKKAALLKSDEANILPASPLDNINADPTRTTYSAKKKRKPTEVQEATPTKSSRSSQRSVTATTAVAYEGEPPRVLTSNSAIQEGSSMVKFLRKHGGTLVASVEDKCNVLCVRDGGLAKTMKVIQAIALGIPIVTDKWLAESAKAEGFLDLSTFKPSVVKQEKEWGFNLEKVWGVAQTPFRGYAIYFTPALRKTYTNFREMDRTCQTLGAKVIAKRTNKHDKVIVLAAEEEDPDAAKMIEEGEACYHKDLLTTSVLRGTLDLKSDEFKIKAKHAKGPRRKGPRKST